MTTSYTSGSRAQRLANACDVTLLELKAMRSAGIITQGANIICNHLPGTLTGLDALCGVFDFNLTVNTSGGGAVFDGSSTGGFPRSGDAYWAGWPVTYAAAHRDFNGSWGAKGGWIYWLGDLNIGPGITIKNFSGASVGVGNRACILKTSSSGVNGGISHGSLTLDDVEISGGYNGILATVQGVSGDKVVIKNSYIHDNGRGDGQTHNIYVSHMDLLVLWNSIARDCHVGQDVKTLARAFAMGFSDTRDTTGPVAAASYSLDLNGGMNTVVSSSIGQEINDSNPYVMVNFQTDRQGQGPHELGILGCDLYSADHYRGYFIKATNRYLDPTKDYHLGAAIQLDWNDFKIIIDGNDAQYVDQDLDYGSRGSIATLPTNSGVTLLSDVDADNRLIATTNPSAGTPYANVDSAKLALTWAGDILAGLGANDMDDTVVAALLARSLALQATWVAPGGTTPTPTPPPDPPPPVPDETPPVVDEPPVVVSTIEQIGMARLNRAMQTLWVCDVAQQLRLKRQPVLTFASAHTLTKAESGCLFRDVACTLPTASPGLHYDLNGGSATKAGSDTIYDGSASGTILTAGSSDACAHLFSPKAGLWFVAKKTGTWSLA